MQLQQVEYFLKLCEELNFTKAARRCGISQPSLTNAIKALEAEVGAPLFARKPSVRLTPLGLRIQPYLVRIANDVENAIAVARPQRRLNVARARSHQSA